MEKYLDYKITTEMVTLMGKEGTKILLEKLTKFGKNNVFLQIGR